MPLVLSSVTLVGLLAIVVVLGYAVVARVPLKGRNLLILLVGFAAIAVVIFSR